MWSRRKINFLPSFQSCLITKIESRDLDEYCIFLKQAVLGGVTMVQLREKESDYDILKKQALALKSVLKPFNVPLIINDNVYLAKEIDADGVHIGQTDMHPDKAREVLGDDKIIGLSVESIQEVIDANLSSLNYVTASAVFKSKTKPNCKMYWGLDGLREVVKLSKHPVTAIGGITKENAGLIINEGAVGIAGVGCFHDYDNSYKAALEMSAAISASNEKKVLKFR